eukprot:14041641-Alexandrium_andersonii.AAC.1
MGNLAASLPDGVDTDGVLHPAGSWGDRAVMFCRLRAAELPNGTSAGGVCDPLGGDRRLGNRY